MKTTRQHHPAAALIPEATPEQYEKIREDIREHGQRVPIILSSNGQIIDGRTRDRACRELGITPLTRPATVAEQVDAVGLVISLNAARRHLSPDQMAAIYLMWAPNASPVQRSQKVRASRDALTSTVAPRRGKRGEGKTAAKVAKSIGVSTKTVERVQKVQKVAPEKVADVAAGKTSAVEVLRENRSEAVSERVHLPVEVMPPVPVFEDISEMINAALDWLEEHQDKHGFKPDEVSALGATFERFTRLMKGLEVTWGPAEPR